MHLRVEVTMDVEAADFIEAADHQRKLEELFRPIAEAYPSANLQIRERRAATPVAAERARALPDHLLAQRRRVAGVGRER